MTASLRLAASIADITGREFARVSGTGAAGALAGSFLGLLGAKLRPGSELVFRPAKARQVGSENGLGDHREGQIDFQTQFGKGPGMLAKTSCPAWRASSRIAGSIAADARKLFERGFQPLCSASRIGYGSHGRDGRRAQLMERTAEQVARLIRASMALRR